MKLEKNKLGILKSQDYIDFKESLVDKLQFTTTKEMTTIEKAIEWLKSFFITISTIDIAATKKEIDISSQQEPEQIFSNITRKIDPNSQTSIFSLNNQLTELKGNEFSQQISGKQKSGFVAFQPDTGIIVTAGRNGSQNESKALPQMTIDPITGKFKESSIDPEKAQIMTPFTKNQIKEIDASGNITITTRNTNNQPISKIIQKTDGSLEFYTIDKQGNRSEKPITTIKPEADGSITITTTQKVKGRYWGTTADTIDSIITLKSDGSITTGTKAPFQQPSNKPWKQDQTQTTTAKYDPTQPDWAQPDPIPSKKTGIQDWQQSIRTSKPQTSPYSWMNE